MIRRIKTIIILLAFFIILSFFIVSIDNRVDLLPVQSPTKTETERLSYFENIKDEIKAKSFCVYNIKDGKIIYSKDPETQLPLASITKLMSALVIDEGYPDFALIEIQKDAILEEGDSGLFEYEKWQKRDLLDFTLITSSNDGIFALSQAVAQSSTSTKDVIEKMNQKAQELGLINTIFFNTSGLDVNEGLSGAYSTALDVIKLLSYIVKNNSELVGRTPYENMTFISENNLKHIAKNTNNISKEIPSLIASKTGFTDLAGGNLVIVFDIGMLNPIAIVVLGSEDSESRFTDMRELVLGTMHYYSE